MQKNLSQKAYEEACKYIPGGVNSPVRALKNLGTTPFFVKKAKGAILTDIDSKKYIDYCMSWGVFILGHSRNQINQAVKKTINDGTSYGIPTLVETQLAKMITQGIPSIEKVRFVNSGTEAVMSAIRLARAYTGKNTIIKFDGCYHGHADHLLIAAGSGVTQLKESSSAGVPPDFMKYTLSLPYNNIAAVENVFEEPGNDVAAIIIEPVAANMGVIPAEQNFLRRIRELTIQHKALLIFDEVITGFRIGYGGAQHHYGITPDLTTLGKIIGGGFPVGAYGGSRQIMALIAPDGPVYQAGTLSGNPIAMTAGTQILETLQNEGIYKRIEDLSKYFYHNLNLAIQNRGIRLQHKSSMFTLFFGENEIRNYEDAKRCDHKRFATFFRYLLAKGIYISPSPFETNFISFSHTRKQLDFTVDVMDSALRRI